MLARREWEKAEVSLLSNSSSSKTGAEPNLRKGKVEGLLEGDWARKYARMGEVPGEGMLTLGEAAELDTGVGGESDSPDDTDTERARPRGNGEGEIGMGLEDAGFSEVLRADMMGGSKRG